MDWGQGGDAHDTSDELLTRYESMREDPWEFLKAVRTIDQEDEGTPIKPFPIDQEYLFLYVRTWQRVRKLAIPKSRRMKISWVNIALYVWEAIFHVGKHIAFVSKKEDDSDELVRRAKFILENLDPALLPKELIPAWDYSFNKLKFPEIHTLIQGFPSGADQLRQFTFSGIFNDEMAFQEDGEKMYSAAIPTIGQTGRFTAVSSPAPSFFQTLCEDKIDGVERVAPAKLYPMQGVEIWKNTGNDFTVFQIHYTADPYKRTPEYRESVRRSMPIRRFMQEMELQWNSFEGTPVYQDWDRSLHGVTDVMDPHIGLPLLLGFDFGLTPACVVCQMQDTGLKVFKEFTAQNMGAQRFMTWITPELLNAFPLWGDRNRDFILFIDPSGMFRKDTDENTCANVIASFGFTNIIPGAIAWEERRQSVEYFLTHVTRGAPSLQVALGHCPVLVRGFNGGYRYPDKSLEVEPQKIRPIKDIHSHVHDALQMVTSKVIQGKSTGSPIVVPRPHFSWTKRG